MRETASNEPARELSRNEIVDQIHTQFYSQLLRYAKYLTGNSVDAAQDLVQTAFFYILRSKAELRWNSDAEMFSYVKTVVQNIWLSQYRARARRLIEVPLEDDGQGSSTKPSMDRMPEFGRSANIEEELLRTEQRELLAQRIAGLSKIYRESLTMYLSGVPITEIASQLGLPESTVWTRINRAKDMLT